MQGWEARYPNTTPQSVKPCRSCGETFRRHFGTPFFSGQYLRPTSFFPCHVFLRSVQLLSIVSTILCKPRGDVPLRHALMVQWQAQFGGVHRPAKLVTLHEPSRESHSSPMLPLQSHNTHLSCPTPGQLANGP